MRTYKEVLEDGIHLLDAAAIEEAGLDAWLLLEYAANINRAWYYAHMDEILDKKDRITLSGDVCQTCTAYSIAAYYRQGLFYGI